MYFFKSTVLLLQKGIKFLVLLPKSNSVGVAPVSLIEVSAAPCCILITYTYVIIKEYLLLINIIYK